MGGGSISHFQGDASNPSLADKNYHGDIVFVFKINMYVTYADQVKVQFHDFFYWGRNLHF